MPLIFTTEEEFLSVDSLSEGKSYDIMMRSVGEEGQNSGLSEIINVVTCEFKSSFICWFKNNQILDNTVLLN